MRRDEQGPASATEPVRRQCRLVNSRAIEKTVGYPLVDGYLTTITMDPPETALKPVPTPTLDEGPHLSYAIQWFCFCALALGGLFVFIRGDIRELRGKTKKPSRRNAPDDAEPGGDVDEPGDVANPAGDDTPSQPHTPAGTTSVAEPEA